ncbi:hypothetical protein V6N13_080333 [Hibiscus sabdariffa]|uniref:Protein TIC 20 n=1 Tax=Hibiscus sabdariffa TaxID=183260 RepID=A0ABR2PY55_9ROSI
MAAATTATLSARSCPKLTVTQSFAGLRSRYSISNRRRSSVHLGYKPSVSSFNLRLQATRIPMFSSNIGAQHFLLSTGSRYKHLSAASMLLSGENEGDLGHKVNVLPVTTKKPEWWWRTLACVPYLIALQISDIGFFLQPFLAHYGMVENLISFVPGAMNGFHPWLLIIERYFGYKWIVKSKYLPPFIRFHAMMGLLLRNSFQLVWYTTKLFPFMQYNGMFGMHFWVAIVLCFILVLLECVRCALAGKYAHIPFVSDVAYAHTGFDIVCFGGLF